MGPNRGLLHIPTTVNVSNFFMLVTMPSELPGFGSPQQFRTFDKEEIIKYGSCIRGGLLDHGVLDHGASSTCLGDVEPISNEKVQP